MTVATPRFQTVCALARGGLGEVSVAIDCELGREVALKRIQGPHRDDEVVRGRFYFEPEVTGGLEHPGIVPIYSLFRAGPGGPPYAMRLIRGESLAEVLKKSRDQGPPPDGQGAEGLASGRRQLVTRFLDVCNAIAYAHSRGVIHRDLKPGNIMLGPFGETLVVDWGLARVISPGGPPGEAVDLPPRGEASTRPTQPSPGRCSAPRPS